MLSLLENDGAEQRSETTCAYSRKYISASRHIFIKNNYSPESVLIECQVIFNFRGKKYTICLGKMFDLGRQL